MNTFEEILALIRAVRENRYKEAARTIARLIQQAVELIPEDRQPMFGTASSTDLVSKSKDELLAEIEAEAERHEGDTDSEGVRGAGGLLVALLPTLLALALKLMAR